MPPQYSVTEPHPTVTKYTHSGRGGAGNIFKAPKTTKGSNAQEPAFHFDHELRGGSSKFSSGRGGAGNVRHTSERPVFSFDEELERQASRDEKMMTGEAVWHVGRGGAGNWTSSRSDSSRKDSSSSVNSDGSSRSGIFARLSRSFDRQ